MLGFDFLPGRTVVTIVVHFPVLGRVLGRVCMVPRDLWHRSGPLKAIPRAPVRKKARRHVESRLGAGAAIATSPASEPPGPANELMPLSAMLGSSSWRKVIARVENVT